MGFFEELFHHPEIHISDFFFPFSFIFFIFAYLLLVKNIASRKKIIQSRYFGMIFSKYSGSFYCWSPTKKFQLASPNLHKLLHLKYPNPTHLHQVIQGFESEISKNLKQKCKELEFGKEFVIEVEFKNNKIITIKGHYLKHSKDKTLCLLAFSDDTDEINKQKQYQETDFENLIYKKMLNTLPIPIWQRDQDLKISDCNQAYVDMVEADSPEQIVRESREVTPEQFSFAKQAFETGYMQKTKTHLTFQGHRHWMKLVESPHYDQDGQLVGVTGYAMDLTPLEEAVKDLKMNMEANAKILENLATPICVFGPDQRLSFFNSAYVDLWNLEEAWLNTLPGFSEILEAQREKRMLPEFADFPAFKKSETKLFTTLIEPFEDMMYLPNGTTLRRRIVPHPLGGLFFTFDDVSDRLALERSYHTKIEVERETINNLHEGIAVFGSDGRLKLQNRSFRDIWELPENSQEAEPHIQDIFSDIGALFKDQDDQKLFKENLIRSIGDHSPDKGEMELNNQNILDYTIVPLPDGNTMLSCTDKTDSILVERALVERNEALMTADRLKTEFLAHISYELRTPLNTILGFTEILLNEYFGTINEKQKEYIDAILLSSRRLATLISDVLDLALVEAGQVSLEKKSIDVCNMLKSVLNLTRESARQHDVSISINCPKDISFLIADERRIKQVLFNLVSNAIKFTPSSGNIVIKASEDQDMIALAVEDTGIGIKDEDHERVFEKFEKGTNLISRKAGLGLGLSLVKRVIELHDGEIKIDSAPEKGTTITCLLPADSSAA